MFFGVDFSLVSFIGIILLMGIVKKNAIMMIDFALEAERVEGLSPEDSIYKACVIRFRPIMMTTMAALLGAVPLAMGVGTGSELRQPLGISVIGGLIVSQVLTLYTTQPSASTSPSNTSASASKTAAANAAAAEPGGRRRVGPRSLASGRRRNRPPKTRKTNRDCIFIALLHFTSI